MLRSFAYFAGGDDKQLKLTTQRSHQKQRFELKFRERSTHKHTQIHFGSNSHRHQKTNNKRAIILPPRDAIVWALIHTRYLAAKLL